MREPVDILIDAAVDAVTTSGAIESVARMATVSAVGTGPAAGTVDVALDEGTVPRVRLLSGYYAPAVGDLVEVMKTSAGWVCLGRLDTPTQPPQIQSGTATTGSATGWRSLVVTFPRPFTAPPVVVVSTVRHGVSGEQIMTSVADVHAGDFLFWGFRTTAGTLPFQWIAMGR